MIISIYIFSNLEDTYTHVPPEFLSCGATFIFFKHILEEDLTLNNQLISFFSFLFKTFSIPRMGRQRVMKYILTASLVSYILVHGQGYSIVLQIMREER